MQVARYILRSLLHYRFAYLGVLLGTVLGATVLLARWLRSRQKK